MSEKHVIGRLVKSLPLSFLGIFALTMAAMAHAQETGAGKCPARAPYTLAKVLKAVEIKAPEDAVAAEIAACHVGFPLDANALDQLSKAGVPPGILDAINKDTLLRLTREQAHTEVDGLEQRERSIENEEDGLRDGALRKLDADYQSQHDQAAQIQPKGQFERTTDYEARVQQNQANLAAMDQKHQADRQQIADQYSAEVTSRDAVFDRRISALRGALYPVAGPAPTHVSYDADGSNLVVDVGGTRYEFTVAPERAQALYGNWKAVKILEPFEDDSSGTRFIADDTPSAPLSGLSEATLAAVAKKKEAEQAAAREAEQARQKEYAHEIEVARQQGYYADQQSGLMWTVQDNGEDIDWNHGFQYCQALRNGGFSDWRPAKIDELRLLFDPSSTRVAQKASGLTVTYRAAPFITLTGSTVWSGEKIAERDGDTIFDIHDVVSVFDFDQGRVLRLRSGQKLDMRVLCVRPLSAPAPEMAAADNNSNIWTDPSTGLTYTRLDNGGPMRAWEARNYCRTLRLDGIYGWQLPDIAQLESLYDVSASAVNRKGKTYHIKGGIVLSDTKLWSTTPVGAVDNGQNLLSYNYEGKGGRSMWSINIPVICVTRAAVPRVMSNPTPIYNPPPQQTYIPPAQPQYAPQTQQESTADPASNVRTVNVSGGIMAAMLISRTEPVYPPLARTARIAGVVVFRAIIGPDGRVEKLTKIVGPDLLTQAAYVAVLSWRYRPYMLNGQPVAVSTLINVPFRAN